MGKILQKKLLSFFYLKICGEMTNLANNNKTKGFFEKLLIKIFLGHTCVFIIKLDCNIF